jgi:branched-chain amino acid transport system ATP-binding protein
MLEVRGLSTGYGDVPVVNGIDLHVGAGELVALLGPNGAGKTTTMLALGGVIPATGEVSFDGEPFAGPLHRRAKRGLGFITEERAVFRQLSTRVNLDLGAGGVEGAVAVFPELDRLLDRQAGLLSGGEQQMLVLGRALAARPRLLLVDELSLGLAPLIVQRLLTVLRDAATDGMGVLVVEQHAQQALAVADRAYVLQRGTIHLEGTGSELLARIGEIERAYLGGLSADGDDPDGGRRPRGA